MDLGAIARLKVCLIIIVRILAMVRNVGDKNLRRGRNRRLRDQPVDCLAERLLPEVTACRIKRLFAKTALNDERIQTLSFKGFVGLIIHAPGIDVYKRQRRV